MFEQYAGLMASAVPLAGTDFFIRSIGFGSIHAPVFSFLQANLLTLQISDGYWAASYHALVPTIGSTVGDTNWESALEAISERLGVAAAMPMVGTEAGPWYLVRNLPSRRVDAFAPLTMTALEIRGGSNRLQFRHPNFSLLGFSVGSASTMGIPSTPSDGGSSSGGGGESRAVFSPLRRIDRATNAPIAQPGRVVIERFVAMVGRDPGRAGGEIRSYSPM
ncbi:hypothetical protein F183_A41940 [Bryobacterales bacterium F-183]|nr:hypothetical protein F183_A41940 [Bryobacterales bacterium F-183]